MTTPHEEGSPQSAICLIGEAPASEEMQRGEPFVGAAGNVLQQCLHASQIARAECYILNVFEERVYRKEGSQLVFNRMGETVWTPKGLTELGERMAEGFRERLAASSANVYVPMGNTPMSAMSDKRGIERWRGSILTEDLPWGGSYLRKIIPTIHPAAVLRGAHHNLYLIAADLRKAKRESAFPEVRRKPRTIIIDPTMQQIRDAFAACKAAKIVANDIEASRGQVSCFSLSPDPSWAISIPIIDEGYKHRWPLADETEIWRLYADLLYDAEITKINQNYTFDLAALLYKNKLVPRGRLEDCMIGHSVMNPLLPKSLDMLTSLYTDEPHYKTDNGLDADFQIIDFPQHWHYNAMDAAIALESWLEIEKLLDADGYRSTYEHHIAALSTLVFMMAIGFKVNVKALHSTRDRVKDELMRMMNEIERVIGRPVITRAPKTAKHKRAVEDAGAININSPDQLKRYFYGELKLKPFIRDGKPAMDDKALSQIYRRDRQPLAKLLQDYRGLKKLSTTYLDVQLDEDLRLRCSYNPRGTWTGRLSSSETVFHTGLNMQNVAPSFREFMEAG